MIKDFNLEKRLWEEVESLMMDSGLTRTEYKVPILGIIFLHFVSARCDQVEAGLKESLDAGGREPFAIDDFHSRGALYVPEEVRFQQLVNLPHSADCSKSVTHAMEEIEKANPSLEGYLPKNFEIFDENILRTLLHIFYDLVPPFADREVGGAIFEYFQINLSLYKDTAPGFTPVPVAGMISEIIEPSEGIFLDPACGAGGLFVHAAGYGRTLNLKDISFYGQEIDPGKIGLAKMNLAIHGIPVNIADGNIFREDKHLLSGRCDYVMAHPPFEEINIKEQDAVSDTRLLLGTPSIKPGPMGGEYFWISYVYSYLNPRGRGGIILPARAADADGDDRDIRRKLLEAGDVEVVISIGENRFYSIPESWDLWFFNRDEKRPRRNSVLMIDGKSMFRILSRKIHDFPEEQLKSVAAIVWLYREENLRYLDLIRSFYGEVHTCADKIRSTAEEYLFLLKQVDGFENKQINRTQTAVLEDLLSKWEAGYKEYKKLIPGDLSNESQLKQSGTFLPLGELLKILRKNLELSFKQLVALLADSKENLTQKGEIEYVHNKVLTEINRILYFFREIRWLQKRFPLGEIQDVPGLVRVVPLGELSQNNFSLSSEHYVGIASDSEEQSFKFEQTIKEIHLELDSLNEEAEELSEVIRSNFEELGL